MQNVLTKQEPKDAYDIDLYELQKNCHLNHIFQINKFHEISVYKKCLWEPGIYDPSIFFPLDHKVFAYHLNSCVL